MSKENKTNGISTVIAIYILAFGDWLCARQPTSHEAFTAIALVNGGC